VNTLSPSVAELTRKYSGIWQALSAEIPAGVRIFSDEEQAERQRRLEALIHDVESSRSPAAARSSVKRFVAGAEGEELGSLRDHSDGFSEASKEFVFRAGKFDRSLREEEIQQALRNLWVFNALQVMFKGVLLFQAGAFAYSLLYPYTDNFFDDPKISRPRKQTFGDWISKRLSGDGAGAGAGVARKVHRLINLIEDEYPRSEYPLVYEGLQAIHDAQLAAMEDLRDISVESIVWRSVQKGGTSVLADALLVSGALNPLEIEFSFRFGVLLQFIDDLQDGKDDGMNRDVTLFSSGRRRAEVNDSARRLIHFLFGTFDEGAVPVSRESRRLREIMRRSCIALVCEAVCRQARRFDGSFVERIAPLCPVHPRYLVSLHDRAPRLRRYFPGGIRSIVAVTD
jgi:hypothetical protein